MIEILKLVLVLAVMIIIIARKIDLVYAIIAGILLTAILFSHAQNLPQDIITTITDFEVINLIIMFIFVFYLSNLLAESGILKHMLESLEKLIRDVRIVIISLPFMIGLVPAPSGAMLSAPFVEEIGSKINITQERKLLINYWFRHITEYLNPIYPGPILLVMILGISFKDIFLLNLPIMLFVFILGFIMYVAKLKTKNLNLEKPTKRDIKLIVNGILPIFIAILLPIVFKVNLTISLLFSIILIALVNKIKINTLKKAFRKSIKLNILLLIFLIMLFKIVLENSRAIELVSNSFLQYGFPPIFLVITIPFIIGLLTGFTIAYVGAGFPLLLPFLIQSGEVNMGFVLLAYVSGYMGVLISPAHLCLLVTQKYFKASYTKVYKQLIIPIILVLSFALLLTLVGWTGF
jgi:integral membrane protein (TIGR00529 family)